MMVQLVGQSGAVEKNWRIARSVERGEVRTAAGPFLVVVSVGQGRKRA